jgi:hypothetical protein
MDASSDAGTPGRRYNVIYCRRCQNSNIRLKSKSRGDSVSVVRADRVTTDGSLCHPRQARSRPAAR